jgi:hypothetical protein
VSASVKVLMLLLGERFNSLEVSSAPPTGHGGKIKSFLYAFVDDRSRTGDACFLGWEDAKFDVRVLMATSISK